MSLNIFLFIKDPMKPTNNTIIENNAIRYKGFSNQKALIIWPVIFEPVIASIMLVTTTMPVENKEPDIKSRITKVSLFFIYN